MTEIQQNRYDQLIRRVNNIVSPGSMVGDALNELFPVIDVERVPGELLALMGTDICVGSSSLTGAPGEVSRIQLFNPVGSGKIITVTQVTFGGTDNTLIRFAVNNTALLTGVGTEVYRDRRKVLTSRPSGKIRQVSTVAFTDANYTFRALALTPYFFTDENSVAVLSPGSGLEVGTITPATQITVNFMWRERVAEPAELNF